MGEYIVRRVTSMIPVLLIASVISFGLLYVLPGDPAIAVLGENAGSQATYQALRHDLGLDQPIYVQYGKWLGRVAHGDLGTSTRTNEPVTKVLLRRLPVSLYVGFAGLLVGVAIGLSAAIISALRPGSRLDVTVSVFALGGIAVPSFWQALIFVYVFAVLLHWVPPSGYTSPSANLALSLKQLALPAIVLGTHSAAVIMRQGRSALIEVLGQDYIATARAKGLGERRVIVQHALKNAFIPIVTIIGLQTGQLVSGAAIVETVFAIPGVGRAAVDAIANRDYPLLQGAVLMLALAVMVANLITDLTYGYLDPRIRYR
ncbi:MAG TPA: ABC transporter permease [Thermomicrobiales bacterium]|jgi:peptide/nickel transport system permease protein